MIILAVTAVVKPERRDEAVRAALEMGAASRAEAGCVAYRFYADLEDPDRFFLYEQWEDEAALARHGKTEHMRVFRERMAALLAVPFEVKRWIASPAPGR